MTTFLRLRNKLCDAYECSITTEALDKHLSIYTVSLHVHGQGSKEVQSGTLYNLVCAFAAPN